jgi:hypothetical protein
MSIDVRVSTRIRRPRREVVDYVLNPANESHWISGISESRQETPGPLGKGTKVRRVASMMGGRIEYTPEVIEFEPDRRVLMSTDSPFPMTVEYTFRADGDAAIFEQRLGGGPTGFSGLLSPLIQLMVRSRVSGDMKRLREILERRT